MIPNKEKFYEDFLVMADQLKAGALLLRAMLAGDPPELGKAREIKEIEHQCDFLTHDIIQRLNKTFILPADRDDIHALARTLDDVIDAIENAAALIPLYRIDRIRGGARELTRVIIDQTTEIRLAVEALANGEGVLDRAIEINRLENEADRIHMTAVGQLLNEETDAIVVLKWKEILDILEVATDACQDVANLLENIVVKHG